MTSSKPPTIPMPHLDALLSSEDTFDIPSGEFTVYGKVYTDPAHSDDVEALYAAMIEHTKQEKGIIYYCLTRDQDERSVFHFFERYENKEAFDRHNETELVQKLMASGWMKGVSARSGKPIEGK